MITAPTGVALVLLLAAGSTRSVPVSGVAREHRSTCAGGGARVTVPPPAKTAARPLSGVELAASPGSEIPGGEPEVRAKADANGRFVLRLAPGTWCLYRAGRALPPAGGRAPIARPGPVVDFFDQGCLEAEKRRCDAVVEVRGRRATVELETSQVCPQPFNRPCYVGPLPP